MQDGLYIVPQYGIRSSAQNRKVHGSATQVRAKGSGPIVMVAALRDGVPRQLDFTAIDFLSMSQYCECALIQSPTVDFHPSVIFGRFQTTNGFRSGGW